MSLIWNFYFIKNEFDLLGQVSENTRFDTLIQESNFNDNPICKTEKETHMYRTDFWTLWERVRVRCFERIALKHVYFKGETDHQLRLDA